ncbi:hypothetical protein [Mycolicibacterium sediminis]|uniref:Uncharacterized protein n=1 Tax=Mycolicibacterium sediminis TaxID=1286180 RepID=A0A7I7R0R6_9MYCO|nr:hypothetical protein [Mycolicibacterium sediminis]BBY31807.1 hypothetical protein MSEDJ_59030 [Mycolicibacterium sediminis]
MKTALLICAATAAALLGAAPAGADPQDLVPYCSGDQTPMDSNCRATPSQIFTHEGSGLTPDVPRGLTPDNVPAI